MAISEVTLGMEEALVLAEYLPISFKTEAERD